MRTIEKVTAFITRPTFSGAELLVFSHPFAGIQIPAGTVELGETAEAAALREAQEETGLNRLLPHCMLGQQDEILPDGQAVISLPARVCVRPDSSSAKWGEIRRGIQVEVLRREAGWAQIRYAEWDTLQNPHYLTFVLQGWVQADALASTRRRYFYHFEAQGDSPAGWDVRIDHHTFHCFWAPLSALPPIIPPQDRWLEFLYREFPPGKEA